MTRLFLGSFEASRNGAFGSTDLTLAELIGRRPQSIRASLKPIAAA